MKETHPCPQASPILGGEGVAEPCNDHTECGVQGSKAQQCQLSAESPAPARPDRAREGQDQEDLSETFASRLFVTYSDNDFQPLWNMKSL